MSDLQSVLPAEPKKSGTALANWIDTNAVIQRVLQSLASEDRSKLVLRCDDLPHSAGNEENLERLFGGLLQMILQKKEEVSTLFLHISCTVDKQAFVKTGFCMFTIQFNTNIIPSTDWFEKNKNRLNEIEAVVAKNKGNVTINMFKSSGCIFSVSLPGKTA